MAWRSVLSSAADASIGGIARIDIGRGDWMVLAPESRSISTARNWLSFVGGITVGILAGPRTCRRSTSTIKRPSSRTVTHLLGTAPITFNGGTLSPYGSHTFANNLVVNSGFIDNQGFFDTYNGSVQVNGPLQINTIAGGNITFNGNLSGSGSITKIGAYSLLLNGDNSGFTGTLTNNQSNTFFTSATAGSGVSGVGPEFRELGHYNRRNRQYRPRFAQRQRRERGK